MPLILARIDRPDKLNPAALKASDLEFCEEVSEEDVSEEEEIDLNLSLSFSKQ